MRRHFPRIGALPVENDRSLEHDHDQEQGKEDERQAVTAPAQQLVKAEIEFHIPLPRVCRRCFADLIKELRKNQALDGREGVRPVDYLAFAPQASRYVCAFVDNRGSNPLD
jgi:hypothetical protein